MKILKKNKLITDAMLLFKNTFHITLSMNFNSKFIKSSSFKKFVLFKIILV